MTPEEIILKKTLNPLFTLVLFSISKNGEEKTRNIRILKSKFFKILKKDYRVRLVEKYPTEIQFNVFYVKKDGRTIWFKERSDE